jgi:acetyl esterase/lipase
MSFAPPPPSPPPITEMRVVHRVPGMDQVQVRRNLVYRTVGETRLELDVYSPSTPSSARRPAVILVHGGPVPAGARPKDWGMFVSYGQMLAASGFTAVTFNHRFYGAPGGELPDAAGDLAAAVAHVRQRSDELGVDRERIALWAFSGGGPLLSAPLRERWPFVRAIAAYYAVLDLQVRPPGVTGGMSDETRREFSALLHLSAGEKTPPTLVARAGKDNPWTNATIDRFVQEALARNAPLELITHPAGEHGFDILNDDDRSREIIARTLDFLKHHLPPRP